MNATYLFWRALWYRQGGAVGSRTRTQHPDHTWPYCTHIRTKPLHRLPAPYNSILLKLCWPETPNCVCVSVCACVWNIWTDVKCLLVCSFNHAGEWGRPAEFHLTKFPAVSWGYHLCLAHCKGAHLCPEQKTANLVGPSSVAAQTIACYSVGGLSTPGITELLVSEVAQRHVTAFSIMSDCMTSDSQLAVSVADTLTFKVLHHILGEDWRRTPSCGSQCVSMKCAS